jgi:hypothetical protein
VKTKPWSKAKHPKQGKPKVRISKLLKKKGKSSYKVKKEPKDAAMKTNKVSKMKHAKQGKPKVKVSKLLTKTIKTPAPPKSKRFDKKKQAGTDPDERITDEPAGQETLVPATVPLKLSKRKVSSGVPSTVPYRFASKAKLGKTKVKAVGKKKRTIDGHISASSPHSPPISLLKRPKKEPGIEESLATTLTPQRRGEEHDVSQEAETPSRGRAMKDQVSSSKSRQWSAGDLEPPPHWPENVAVDRGRRVPWLPMEWGQGWKRTVTGTKVRVFVSPEGRLLYSKKSVEEEFGAMPIAHLDTNGRGDLLHSDAMCRTASGGPKRKSLANKDTDPEDSTAKSSKLMPPALDDADSVFVPWGQVVKQELLGAPTLDAPMPAPTPLPCLALL